VRRFHGLWVITFLALIILSGGVMAEDSTMVVQDGVLFINACTNHFANLVHYADFKGGEYEEVSFETKIRGGDGTSWAPGLYLYWRASNSWVSIRFVGNHYTIEGNLGGRWFRYRDPSLKHIGNWKDPITDKDWICQNRNAWNRFKILLTPEDMSFYVAYQDEDWQFLCTLDRVITDEEPYFIIGKGYAGGAARPYLTNSHANSGSLRALYFDDAVVKLDGQVILKDTFDKDIGKHWTHLIEGDPDIDAKISYLDALPTKGYDEILEGVALIYPNPSLNGDGVRIAYHISELGRVKVAIYNEEGQLIWEKDAVADAMGYNEVSWDGYGKGGHKVPPGLYTCVVSHLKGDKPRILSMGRIIKAGG
jgi:hypothetical protein